MRPLIRSGKDKVAIAPLKDPVEPWDVVLYSRIKRGEHQHVLHRVLSVEGGVCIILGDNCVSLERIPLDDVMGVMVSLERKGKAVDFGGWRYQAYLRWWIKPWRQRVAVLRRTHAIRRAAGKVLPQAAKDRINRLF